MATVNPLTDRLWKTPAVRHLAWLCYAPALIRSGPVFQVRDALPADVWRRLEVLDESPRRLLQHLDQSQSRRLGHYFEQLYEFLLTDILGWTVVLRNAPVRSTGGRTLGELDFVVRNPDTGTLEHHEVAVKYYLGVSSNPATHWYGPNTHDRLDLKTRRMLDHQCRMTERPETRALLLAHGLDEPVTPALVMPGNLFYPAKAEQPLVPPDWVAPGHERGRWIHHGDLDGLSTDHWQPLFKPDWLGPYQSTRAPDTGATVAGLAHIAGQQRPGLFASMIQREDKQGFMEYERWFVVPDGWPAGAADQP